MRPIRTSILGVLFVLFVEPINGLAQNSSPSDQETIRQLVEQVKELQQQDHDLMERVKALEAGQSPGTHSNAPDSGAAPVAAPVAEEAPAPPITATQTTDWHDVHSIQWRGFGEVNYKVLNQRKPETGFEGFEPGSAGNFYTGDFGLFLTSKLTEKASVLAEIVFQQGDAQSYHLNLRRMLLKYDYKDYLEMSFGRYQTNIGYYNWAFRSAAWLQTTADRPLIMEYTINGGLLPTQAIGVSLTGAIPSGKLGLHYVAEYGSSDTIRPDINGDGLSSDENNGNQVNVGLFIRPDAVPGLQMGSSFYHDKMSNSVQGPSVRYGQTIINGYIVYIAHGIEFLNEGFLIRDSALHFSNAVFDTPAFYTQFSKKIGRIRPFFRYQYVNAGVNDLIYDDVGLRLGPSFGARYDFNDYMSFTAQLDHTVRRGLPDLNGLQLQWAFTF